MDSLKAIPDSLKTTEQKNESYGVDTTVFASAKDSLIFFVKDKKMKLYGESDISYKQTDIKSADIFIDFDKNLIDATGIPSDSVKGKMINTPVLKDGSEVYEGQSMKYNYKNASGIISAAQTEQEGSKYTGSKIKKVDKDTYFIKDGTFTTCDSEDPDYYFSAVKMKVIQKEQLVADWIFIYFGGVPFPVPLPFAVFPLESGRRSGIIPPVFGSDGTYGTYFSRFGYFWAINDYMDVNLTADYYTRGSYKLNSRYRYSKRYNYSGNLEGSYGKFIKGEITDPGRYDKTDWRIKWDHNQTITPTLKFNAKLEFLSGSTIQRGITNFNELLRNSAISNATISKQWEESGNSMTLSYTRSQDFERNTISEVLPSLSFSLGQSYPFRHNLTDQAWYETFGFNYTGLFQNNRNKSNGNLAIRGGVQHSIRTTLAPKIGHFSITPYFNYNEIWYNKRIEKYTAVDDSGYSIIKTNDLKQINEVRTFNLGVSASTKFYGMFNINSLGINAIRHTVIPSITYTYSPDFTAPFWGYYSTYLDSLGRPVKYNKFEKEIFGLGNASSEQQLLSFSLGNLFEMKTIADPTDTTSKENKIQLLNLNAGISYNFAADSFKVSNLTLGYRTQIGNIFNFQGGSTFSPYSYTSTRDRINKFLVDDGKGLLRLTNFYINLSLTISGQKIASKEKNENASNTTQPEDQNLVNSERSLYQGLYSNREPDFSIPWDLSLNYNYSESKPRPDFITKSSSISGNINFNLTPSWKFSVAGSYDLQRQEFAAPQVRISRDLHCWIMNFTWNPIGTYRGYTFEIRVKAPQLQDLKITKRDQFYNGR